MKILDVPGVTTQVGDFPSHGFPVPIVISLRSVLSDLRRRKVFRVLGVYLVGAWIVVQVVETVFPVLLIPDFVVRAVVVLAIAGAPVTVGLAWAFEWTPGGLERTGAASDDSDPISRDRGEAEEAPPRHTLAVLPFADLSVDGSREYLSDGITQEILSEVARIPELQVAARTSAFEFKGQNRDVREIGRRLGVRSILEGSVQTDGDQLRVTAQLVDAVDGSQIFSESYDSELDDVFQVQEEVARRVAHALQLELEPGEERPGTRRSDRTTKDLEAYRDYLRGTRLLARRTPPALEGALGHFDRALEQDPRYPLARAKRAETLALLEDLGHGGRTGDFAEAAREAEGAVDLAPDLPESHAVLGLVRTLAWIWDGAEASFLRALEIESDHPDALQWYSVFLTARGRLDEAVEVLERARARDPLSRRVHSSLAALHFYARNHEAALERVRSARGLSGDDPLTVVVDALVHEATGEPERARTLLRERGSRSRTPVTVAALGHVEATLGVLPAARQALRELGILRRRGHRTGFCAAGIHVALGDHDAAFDELHRAVDEHDGWILALKVHPWFDPLRNDARYADLTASVGLGSEPGSAGSEPGSATDTGARRQPLPSGVAGEKE